MPEHFDARYVATLLPTGTLEVVMDKLFIFSPTKEEHADFYLCAMSSLLTWYQLEQRGRTQLGQGVLEMKKADWEGILIVEATSITAKDRKRIQELFLPLRNREALPLEEELQDPDRIAFDLAYLEICGVEDPDSFRKKLERELRANAAERRERARSVEDAKTGISASRRPSATIDAYASRIASGIEFPPDPRIFAKKTTGRIVQVEGPIDGPVTIGSDLFSHSDLFCGDRKVASAEDPKSAAYVRGVLLHDPEVESVDLPPEEELGVVVDAWESAVSEWRQEFDEAVSKTTKSIADPRVRAEIRERALSLLHAQDPAPY